MLPDAARTSLRVASIDTVELTELAFTFHAGQGGALVSVSRANKTERRIVDAKPVPMPDDCGSNRLG